MIRRPPRSTLDRSSAASDVYKRQVLTIVAARIKYLERKAVPESDVDMHGAGKILNEKFYIDEIYNAVIVKPLHALSEFFYKIFDLQIIDGFVNGAAKTTGYIATQLKSIQTGNVSFYLFAMALGMGGIILLIILM